MSFGRVISGGKPMTKGLTKPINDKRETFMAEYKRREVLSNAVKKAIYVNNLSDPNLNNVEVGQKGTKFGGRSGNNFTTPKKPSKV